MKRIRKPSASFIAKLVVVVGFIALATWACIRISLTISNASWLRQLESDTELRAYTLPDVRNVRDCGGWMTKDGQRIRFGRLFRSGEFNNTDAAHPERHFMLSDSSRAMLTDSLGIRTDIDIRGDHECVGMTGSPLGSTASWRHIPFYPYENIGTPAGRAAFAEIFRALLDEKTYPAIVHCRAGRDRAGTAVMLLNALLGVPEEDLRRDWEFTERSRRNVYFNYRLINGAFKVLSAYPGDTINARAEAFVHSLGFTDDDISKFRKLMLETPSINKGDTNTLRD